MCGIVYSQNFKGKPVNNDVLNMFDNQRHRGTEGFGLFDGQKMHMVHATKEDKILKWFVKYDSNLILFHHRYPTSTSNVKRTAHPFSTKDYFGDDQYILVHNGVIQNDWDLFDDHQELGIKYYSKIDDFVFNDSESLLWDFALAMQQGRKSLKAYGSIAFICLKLHKGKLDKMYFARNYLNPLHIIRTKTGISLASEGEGELIDTNTLYTWNYKLKRLTKSEFEVPSYAMHSYNDDDYYYKKSAPEVETGDVITEDNMDWFRYKRNKVNHVKQKFDNQINVPMAEDDILEEMETYMPQAEQVQAMALAYLNYANGHFDTAYYCLEADYIELESLAKYLTHYKKLKLMEYALKWLDNDPDYVNNNSVSSLWVKGGAIGQAKLLNQGS